MLFAAVALTAYAVDVLTKIWAVRRASPTRARCRCWAASSSCTSSATPAPPSAPAPTTPWSSACWRSSPSSWSSSWPGGSGSLGWAVALGLLLAGVAGNLTDRVLREPGAAARPRHRLPAAAELAGLQRRRHLHQRRGRADHLSRPSAAIRARRHPRRRQARPTDEQAVEQPDRPSASDVTQRRAPHASCVPDGLAGERVDAAMARMFGLSRTRAADLIARGPGRARRRVGRQERPGARRGDARRDASRPGATRSRSCPRSSRGSGSSTTTTSIVVIDKPVGVAVHPSPGLVRADRRRAPRRRRLPDLHQRCLRAAGHRAAPRRRHLRA